MIRMRERIVISENDQRKERELIRNHVREMNEKIDNSNNQFVRTKAEADRFMEQILMQNTIIAVVTE